MFNSFVACYNFRVQLSEPKSPESLSANSVLPSTENEVSNSADRSALRLPLSQQATAAKPESPNSSGKISYTGRARLIRSHSSARFCFELSGNSNYILHCNSNYVENFELEINSI